MEVVGEKGERVDADRIESLRPCKASDENGGEFLAGAQQVAALDGPAGDLDEAPARG